MIEIGIFAFALVVMILVYIIFFKFVDRYRMKQIRKAIDKYIKENPENETLANEYYNIIKKKL